MVVKNVAGLDMAKLMIGSFGTLAAIAVVNFKLDADAGNGAQLSAALRFRGRRRGRPQPHPEQRAAAGRHRSAEPGGRRGLRAARLAAGRARRRQPRPPWTATERELARIAGRLAVEKRPPRDPLAATWRTSRRDSWTGTPDGAVVRASCTLKELEGVMASFEGPALARAGSGVCYGYFEQSEAAAAWLAGAAGRGWKAVIEFAPEERKRSARPVAVSGRRFGNHAAGQEPVRSRQPVEPWPTLSPYLKKPVWGRGSSIWTAASTAGCA